jgi:hypothetical protein
MKFWKTTVQLLTLSTVALLALVAASPAAAETTLCKAAENPCGATNRIGIGAEYHAALKPGTAFVKEAGSGIMRSECKQVEFAGLLEQAVTPSGKLTTLKFGECTSSGYAVLKGGQMQFHWTIEHNGRIAWKGFEIGIGTSGTGGESGSNCVYGGEVGEGMVLKGGSRATLAMSITVPRISGSLLTCPATQVWKAEFEFTAPNPLYVSSS